MSAARCDPGRGHLEVTLGIGNDLAVGQMIGGFDRDDALTDGRLFFTDVLRKLGLRTRWPNDQDFAGVAERVRDLRQEFLVWRRMAAADLVCLVMKMTRRQ